jgi:hypothetical protein
MNYDWHEYGENPWPERFPDWVLGYEEWMAFADRLESPQTFQGFIESSESLQDF